MNKLTIFGFLFLSLSSCTSYKYGTEGNAQKSNLTMGVVKSQIVKGKTTQDEILKLFGAPNLVSKNKSNKDVWSYNKMSVENKAGSTDFFTGQRASQSSSSRSFDLIITLMKMISLQIILLYPPLINLLKLYKMKKVFTLLFSVAMFSSCATKMITKSPAEVKMMTTKQMESNQDLVFKSIISLLQSESYMVERADKETGLINAVNA